MRVIDYGTAMAGARFTEDRTYRYQLWRMWDPSKTTLCGLFMNPSKADQSDLDPTTARFSNRAHRWGFGGWRVVNIDALVSTDSSVIDTHPAPHEHADGVNLVNIVEAAVICHKRVILGFGASLSVRRKAVVERVIAAMDAHGIDLYCIKESKDGWPMHPLYLPYDLKPTPWDRKKALPKL